MRYLISIKTPGGTFVPRLRGGQIGFDDPKEAIENAAALSQMASSIGSFQDVGGNVICFGPATLSHSTFEVLAVEEDYVKSLVENNEALTAAYVEFQGDMERRGKELEEAVDRERAALRAQIQAEVHEDYSPNERH